MRWAPQAGTDETHLRVDLSRQTLVLAGAAQPAHYRVSTASRGAGCTRGSFCTPTGWHRIRARIGQGLPAGTVFVGRRPTGEIYSDSLGAAFPARDWILSRILWLDGLEPGHNRGGDVDTLRRYVYIHGTADEHLLGQPASHGCIRMGNDDIVALFDRVACGMRVHIVP